jgi:hypothetical protein
MNSRLALIGSLAMIERNHIYMGLSYYYSFSAPKTVPASELEKFLKSVERQAKALGFEPTFVLNGPFTSEEQKQFARRITGGLLVNDPCLKGVTLIDTSKVWDYSPETGECRVIPEYGVLLVLTDDKACETVFGFFSYPEELADLNRRKLVDLPHKGRWFFHDFVDSSDLRYRIIVKYFADAGFLEHESDEFI